MLHRGDRNRWLRYFLFTFFICFFIILLYPSTPKYHEVAVIGWEKNITRNTKLYINPENETYIISGREICLEPKVELVVVVSSAPENLEMRRAVRRTWARHNLTSVRVAFILGTTLNNSLMDEVEEESAQYKDIVQENFFDSYNNLTIKSIMTLKWFLKNCPEAKYLMKTDDDMFVNISRLYQLLTQSDFKSSALLIGSLNCKVRPILDSRNKWYTPRYMFPRTSFPDYLSGTGYVMSHEVARRLYAAALVTPIFHLEDVYITGICASKAGIRPRNHYGFTYNFYGVMAMCRNPQLITNHHLSPLQMYQAWEERANCTPVPSTPPPPISTPARRLSRRFRPVCS